MEASRSRSIAILETQLNDDLSARLLTEVDMSNMWLFPAFLFPAPFIQANSCSISSWVGLFSSFNAYKNNIFSYSNLVNIHIEGRTW
jgi:hypothetical protein